LSPVDAGHDRRASSIDLSDLGIVAAACAGLFAARFTFQQTWLAWHPGAAAASYAPELDVLGWAALGLGVLWVLVVGVMGALRSRPVTALDAWLIGIVALSTLLCAVPGEAWRLATARAAGARHAPKDWVIWSAARGEIRLLDYLLSHGADPNARISSGQTALGAAAAAGQVGACESLIAAGARVDGRTAVTNQTALLEAVEEGRLDVARLLMAHGARSDARDIAGLSAADWALLNQDPRMLALLEGRTASGNSP
jgi:uncharacterized protein